MIMKYVKLFENLLTEKEKETHDYGCVMIYFDFPVNSLHDKISPEDVYTTDDPSFGLEKEPHVTLLYGLHSAEISDEVIWDICKKISFGPITLTEVSSFKNDNFEVLKFDAVGNGLHECNRMLSELPNSNSYPEYQPHMTIAYLKTGTSDKYDEDMKGVSYIVFPKAIVYSKPNGEKIMKSI